MAMTRIGQTKYLFLVTIVIPERNIVTDPNASVDSTRHDLGGVGFTSRDGSLASLADMSGNGKCVGKHRDEVIQARDHAPFR